MHHSVTSVFVDRERELGVLGDAFAAAASGEARVLILEGEAGIGKTTLTERFLASLDDARLLRAAGDQSESDVSFATADQLLRAAGSVSEPVRNGRHVTVGLELLEVMTSSGAGETCVVVLDDAHLADAESLRALLFAARRLTGARALLLLAMRGAARDVLPEGWLKLADVLRLSRLAPEHVRALGQALGVEMTQEAAGRLWEHTAGNPLHLRAMLEELPVEGTWQQEQRPLPVPKSYAELIERRLDRCAPDAVCLIEAAAVLGVRATLRAVAELGGLETPLETVDEAIASGLVDLDDSAREPMVVFSHPLVRAAVYEALPRARRAALNAQAARVLTDPAAALRHRVEATTTVDASLLEDLEAHAHAEIAHGKWVGAVSSLSAASRLHPLPAERERLALEAIEATMYSGDGATARRLIAQTAFADGPRRDSVLAYLAIFAGDLAEAHRLLTRAWSGLDEARDPWLAASIAQRSAFLASSRLRGREAIEWAQRATALAPGDPATGLLVAPSLALGMSFIGEREQAHAALDRWLDDTEAPERAAGFVLRALKGFLLTADGDLRAARAAFEASARQSLQRGLLVVAALSLSGLAHVEYLAGEWDGAIVSSERAIALAIESDDQWVVGQAHWRAAYVPAGRGDWSVADSHVRAIQEQSPTFERHIAASAIATAEVAGARDRPADVLAALAPLEHMRDRDGVHDPAFLPWQRLKLHALVDLGRRESAEAPIDATLALAEARRNPLLIAQTLHARGKLEFGRRELAPAAETLHGALDVVKTLGMPYEQARIELTLGQVLRRAGDRRVASSVLTAAHDRFNTVDAEPARGRCETELAACGLKPTSRKSRDHTALTPQELAVTRMVVAGMTNREVSEELMLSTKTVEFHLSNIYGKLGIRTRSELRARARSDQLSL